MALGFLGRSILLEQKALRISICLAELKGIYGMFTRLLGCEYGESDVQVLKTIQIGKGRIRLDREGNN